MTAKTVATDELRMSEREFDRIMTKALSVKPEDAKKPKRSARSKPRKKTSARK